MAKIELPKSLLFATPIAARLRETVALIGAMTAEDAAFYPERSDHDWPRLDRLELDAERAKAVQSAWWDVVTAVEERVEAIDPDAGGYNEAYCRPVYRIYGRHWLAVAEAAGMHVIEPLLPQDVRARLRPQPGLWARHQAHLAS